MQAFWYDNDQYDNFKMQEVVAKMTLSYIKLSCGISIFIKRVLRKGSGLYDLQEDSYANSYTIYKFISINFLHIK